MGPPDMAVEGWTRAGASGDGAAAHLDTRRAYP